MAREDRHLSFRTKRNRESIAPQLFRYLYYCHRSPCIKGDCFKKTLRELFAIRPDVCTPLTSMNRRVRLACCIQHRDWSMDY
ncbi:hypothetical protein TNCV_3374821 [Trichonephila clavipes]|nr:hypothetical protein TNCV_3374821 [Trichonephila clavipes]